MRDSSTQPAETRGITTVVWVVILFALIAALVGMMAMYHGNFGLFGEPGPEASFTVAAESQNGSATGQTLLRIEHTGEKAVETRMLRVNVTRVGTGERVASFLANGGGSPTNVIVMVNTITPPPKEFEPGDQLQITEAADANYAGLTAGGRYRVRVVHTPTNATLGNATVTLGGG